MISLIWIKRISAEEDSWIEEYLQKIDNRYETIIVGHTNIDINKYNFKYIPFYEHDNLGLICHKKNLGVKYSSRDYCLVLHADICPDEKFYDIAISKNYTADTAICPIGFYNNQRALSWCNHHGNPRNKDPNEAADKFTYISGAAIFGHRNLFLKFPWDERLRHNQEEDVEISRRMMNSGIKLIADNDLNFFSKRSQ